MADVLLREYVDELRGHVQAGRYPAALDLGHYILHYYPKHLETYRLLAEASLETADLDAAADLFRRVRSADPENMVALFGLSIVSERQDKLDEAIWHLERAFEIQPMNAELRKELLRLYAEREGTPRERLKLTAGALARLYAREGLFPQAIQEFRALLRADPTRIDIQVALAETLYRAGRMQEAAQVAQSLLQQLPFCLKANLLLGRLWSENNISDGEKLLQRAQALDPENTIARELIPDHWEQLPPARLPRVGESPAAGGTAAFSALFDLPTIIAPAPPTESEVELPEVSVESPVPGALELAQERAAEVELPVEASVAQAPPPPSEIETTLTQLAAPASEEPEAIAESPAAETTATEAITVAPIPESPVAETATTEPITAAAPPEPPPLPPVEPSLPNVGQTIEGAEEKLPAWLYGPGSTIDSAAQLAEAPAPEREAAPPALPPQPPRAETAPPTRHSRLEQIRKQIEELRGAVPSGSKPTAAETVPTAPPASAVQAEAPSDWLSSVEVLPAGTEAVPAASVSSEQELPTWLHPTASTSTPTPTPTPTAPNEAVPDWLRPAASASSPTATPTPPAPNEAVPDWLRSSVPASAPTRAEQVIPEWLKSAREAAPGISPEPGASQTVAVETLTTTTPPVDANVTETTLPDWLQPTAGASTLPTAESGVSEAPAPPPTVEPPQAAAPSTPSATQDEALAEWVKPEAITTDAASTDAVPIATRETREEASPPAAETGTKVKSAVEPEAWLAQARELHASGRWAEAIEIYEKVLMRGSQFQSEVIAELEAIAREPKAPMSVHRLLGDSYAMAGRFKESLEQYRMVLGK